MQRRRAALAAACLTLAFAPTAAEAAAKCPGTKVARTLAGKRTCVPAASLRAIVPAKPPVVEAVNDVFGPIPLSAAARRMLGDLRPPPPLLPPAFKRVVLTQTPALWADLTRAADAAQHPATAARALLAVTVVKDGVTLTQNADGSVRASASARAVDGDKTVKVGLELGADKDGSLDRIGFQIDYDDAKGGASFGIGFSGKSTLPACPDADGLIPGQITQDLSFLKGERFRLGPAKFGSYSQSTKVKARVTIRGTLGPDAKLTSILYDFQETFEIAHSGNALGFLQTSWVGSVKVKAKGKLDPKTGQPIGGSSTITPRVVSAAASPSERAAITKAMGELGDKRLREALGDVLKRLREVETNAQTPGKCVTIVANPAPSWSLRAGSTTSVSTTLKTKDGASVDKVDWTASASLGSITPPTAKAPAPSFTITGAGPTGGKTAKVKWHAVSPAGIADLEGEATDDPFPPRLVGTVSSAKDDPVGVHTEWASSVVYTKDVDRTNPDGSRTVIYNLTSASITSGQYLQTPYGICADAFGMLTAPGGTVKAGDLEFLVGGPNPGTYKLLHDVAMEVSVVARNCPPMTPPIMFDGTLLPFLNTGYLPFTGFPLSAAGMPLANQPGFTGTMSWSVDAG